MAYHNGAPFSTGDNDNDQNHLGRNCAIERHGAWWYKDCQTSNLNGRYYSTNMVMEDSVNWYFWKGNFESLMEVTMLIRQF